MPVKSQKQFRWLAANRPDLLHKWQQEYPRKFGSLPKRLGQPSRPVRPLRPSR